MSVEGIDYGAIAKETAKLTIAQLAFEAQTTPERLRDLQGLGLLDADASGFSLADVGRIRIIEELTRRGVPLEDLARATTEGALSFSWFGGVLPPPRVSWSYCCGSIAVTSMRSTCRCWCR